MGKATGAVVQPGDRFGRGKVLETFDVPGAESPHKRRRARLACDCGNIYEVSLYSLTRRDPIRSCGCLKGRPPVHGLTLASEHHPLYGIWSKMMHRCYNTGNIGFQHYGGRGITVCERWHDPLLFIADIETTIGPRPPGMTLDRADNDSEYGPGKVRWADKITQLRNSRQYKDGRWTHPLYKTWWRKLTDHPDQVCDRWRDWNAFLADVADLGPRPDGWYLLRIDLAGLYETGNIRWSRSPR